jgi:hypothetical protein
VPRKGKLPQSVVKYWPEVLKDIDIKVIPIPYVHSIRVTFNDGKIWDIDVDSSRKKKDLNVEKALEDLFKEYENAIQNVDFRLNTTKVKEDIKKRTTQFIKTRK